MSASDPRELSNALRRVVRGLSGVGGGDMVAILGCWDQVVGDHVAAHARPRRLRGDVLHVEVDQSGWATQLRYLRGQIASGLNEHLGREVVGSIELSVSVTG